MKRFLNSIIIIASCFGNVMFAQETAITAKELAELRKNPDTSKTVYITEKDRIGGALVSSKEQESEAKINKIKTYEDPENQGVFISEAQVSESKTKVASEGITFGQMKAETMSEAH